MKARVGDATASMASVARTWFWLGLPVMGLGLFLLVRGEPAAALLLLQTSLLVIFLLAMSKWRRMSSHGERLAKLAVRHGFRYVDGNRETDALTHRPAIVGLSEHILIGHHHGRPLRMWQGVSEDVEKPVGESGVRHGFGHLSTTYAMPFAFDNPSTLVRPRRAVQMVEGEWRTGAMAFDRTFTVRASDRRFASDLLHPRMLEVLMRAPGWTWSFGEGSIVAQRRGAFGFSEMRKDLALMDAVASQLPRHARPTATTTLGAAQVKASRSRIPPLKPNILPPRALGWQKVYSWTMGIAYLVSMVASTLAVWGRSWHLAGWIAAGLFVLGGLMAIVFNAVWPANPPPDDEPASARLRR